MEIDHIKAVRRQLRQIESEITEVKTMMIETKDKLTNLQIKQAKNQMAK